MTTVIRAAAREDLAAVLAIEEAAFGAEAWSAALVKAELDDLGPVRFASVAEESGDSGQVKLTGYAVGRSVGAVADIARVAVLPARRRTGVGLLLLSELVAEARRRGCDRALLEVAADNVSALALYTDAGFETIDRRARYYSGDKDALVMRLMLSRLATHDVDT